MSDILRTQINRLEARIQAPRHQPGRPGRPGAGPGHGRRAARRQRPGRSHARHRGHGGQVAAAHALQGPVHPARGQESGDFLPAHLEPESAWHVPQAEINSPGGAGISPGRSSGDARSSCSPATSPRSCSFTPWPPRPGLEACSSASSSRAIEEPPTSTCRCSRSSCGPAPASSKVTNCGSPRCVRQDALRRPDVARDGGRLASPHPGPHRLPAKRAWPGTGPAQAGAELRLLAEERAAMADPEAAREETGFFRSSPGGKP